MVNGSTLRAYHLLRCMARAHTVDLVAFAAPSPPAAAEIARLREWCREVTIVPKSPFAPVRSGRRLWSATPDSLWRTDDPELRALVAERAAGADLAIGCQLSAARYLDGVAIPALFEEAEPGQIRGLVADATSPLGRLRRRLTWWKHAGYLARLCTRMAAVTVVSEAERLVLGGAGVPMDKIHVVPNGAAAEDLDRPHRPARPARVVYPGSVTYEPNFAAVRWFLTDVLPRIRAARPDVEYWVTGDVGDRPVHALPNADAVRFTGRLPDVKTAVGDATATVVPLLVGGGTRLKVLESLALGTPVVSTTKGVEGLAVAAGHDVLLADDAESFARQVLEVLNDPVLADRLSAAGRDLVRRHYTWDAIGDRFLALVEHTRGGTGS